MINLRISAAVLALTAAGYAGSALAQQAAPPSDPTAQTTQPAPSTWTTSPGVEPSATTPPPAETDSATTSGTPSSATPPDTSPEPTMPASEAKPGKKAKKGHPSHPAASSPAPDQSKP